MNILFLDMDGVINTSKTDIDNNVFINGIEYHDTFFDKTLVNNVNILCEKFNLKIVCNSTWRFYYSNDILIKLLKGVGLSAPIIGQTTHDRLDKEHENNIRKGFKSQSRYRGMAVSKWLEENKEINIEKYLIIDDNINAGHGHDIDKFVNTNVNNGFDHIKLKEAISKLS